MSKKIDKLLKVLDMPERELDKNRGIHQPQYEWLYAHAHEYGFIMKIPLLQGLASDSASLYDPPKADLRAMSTIAGHRVNGYGKVFK